MEVEGKLPAEVAEAVRAEFCQFPVYTERASHSQYAPTRHAELKLHHQVWGTGPEKVILIQGFGQSHQGYQYVVDRLPPEQFTVCIFDNRGIGDSPAYPSYKKRWKTTELAADVLDLCAFLHWTERIHVLGFSLGGMIAQEVAAARPDLVASLTLAGTQAGGWFVGSLIGLPSSRGRELISKQETCTNVEERLDLLCAMNYDEQDLSTLVPVQGWMVPKREIVKERYRVRIAIGKLPDPLASHGQKTAAMGHCLWRWKSSRVVGAGIPVLVLAGEADLMVSVPATQALARQLSAKHVVIVGAGHAMYDQQPEVFIKEFRANMARAGG